MTSRIRIFDHFCKPLAELHGVPTTPRRWKLNGWNTTEFSVGYDPTRPQSAQKFSEKNFQFGNLVHIEHIPARDWTLAKKGQLPSWTGIILPSRDWDDGIGHVTCYSAEAILQFRAMKAQSIQNTPKNIFTEIMRAGLERAKNIPIQPGILDDLPFELPDKLATNAYDEIVDLIKHSGMDWDVKGEIDEKGNLRLSYNLYKRKGIVTPLILDASNTEMQGPRLSEQGTPTNIVYGYSDANTANDRIGPLVGIHQGAVDDYGPLELNQVFQNMRDPGSVSRAAQTVANLSGRPRKVIKRIALDKGQTFSYLNVGNYATVKDTRVGFHPNGGYGFESSVRILSMDYNDMSDKVVLNVEVLG